MTKKWDSKKLKLPMDYKIPFDFFDRFQHAPNIHPKNNPNIALTPADDADVMEYNYDNENDRNYCSRVVDASDTEAPNMSLQLHSDNCQVVYIFYFICM